MAGLTTVTSGGIADGSITNADINASASIDASKISGLDSITEGNTTVEVVDTGSDGHITFDTEGNERMRIDSSGNVGIGATSPSQLLELKGSNAQLIINGTTTTDCGIEFQNNATSFAEIKLDTSSGILDISETQTSGVIAFSTGASGTERMRIDSSGRLLIGTTSALTGGTSQYSRIVAMGNSTGSTSPGVISVGMGTTPASGNYIGRIFFVDNAAGEYAEIAAQCDGTPGSGDYPGRLVFSTTADGASSPTERMRIDSNGLTDISATNANGYGLKVHNEGNNSDRYGIAISCGTNAATGTNYAVAFWDGDGTAQGYITFTGGTVTYGAFTAHHPCILPEADNEAGYAYGTLLEVVSIEYTQKDGVNTERGILYQVQKSQSANSRKLLGAYGSSMNNSPEGETNRHQALVLGDGHILCNSSGGNIEVGDGICSSATAGIGQKATASPSMIIGIAQENVTFANDTEQKLVAVQYGLQQFIPWS